MKNAWKISRKLSTGEGSKRYSVHEEAMERPAYLVRSTLQGSGSIRNGSLASATLRRFTLNSPQWDMSQSTRPCPHNSETRRRSLPWKDRKSTRLNSSDVKISYAVF